jgi:biotin operon repressor
VKYLPLIQMNEFLKSVSSDPKTPAVVESHALLHEMIRSFTTLARTLNLSHAVKELGSTRQTVRRHIAQLEEAKGVALFTIEDRQYRLTEAGRRALPEARDILIRGRSWLLGHVSHLDGMQRVMADLPEGRSFWLQQRPIGNIWLTDRPLLRECFRAWALAGGQLENQFMEHVRPYFMVYRKTPIGWVCVEIGDNSSYVSWFGWTNARSSIGRSIEGLPGGEHFAHLMVEPFEDAAIHQNSRLDHIHMQLQRESEGEFVPLSYQRLLLAGRFPDNSFALISILDRCHEIEIEDLDIEQCRKMPLDLVMPAQPKELKFEQIVSE